MIPFITGGQSPPVISSSQTDHFTVAGVADSFHIQGSLHNTDWDLEPPQHIHMLLDLVHIRNTHHSPDLDPAEAACLEDYGPMKVEYYARPTEFHLTSSMLPQHNFCQQIEQTHIVCLLVFSHGVTTHIG